MGSNTTDIPIMVISDTEAAVEIVVLFLITIVALLGNVSLWIIIAMDKKMQTTANGLVLCLSGADILVSAINMPMTIYNLALRGWVLQDHTCVALGFISMLTFVASVMSLASISINRYILICHSTRYGDVYTPAKTVAIIIGTWLFSAALAIPPLLGWGRYNYLPGQSFCFCEWKSSISYTFFMVSVCFGGPCTVMSFSYAKILQEVRNSKKRLEQNAQKQKSENEPSSRLKVKNTEMTRLDIEIDVSTASTSGTSSNKVNTTKSDAVSKANLDKKERKRQEEFKLTMSFLVVILTFIVLWLPFCITMFISVFSSEPVPRIPDMVTLLLGCFNSCCNPIIYGVMNKKFRAGYAKLYCAMLKKRQNAVVHVPGTGTTDTFNTLQVPTSRY